MCPDRPSVQGTRVPVSLRRHRREAYDNRDAMQLKMYAFAFWIDMSSQKKPQFEVKADRVACHSNSSPRRTWRDLDWPRAAIEDEIVNDDT